MKKILAFLILFASASASSSAQSNEIVAKRADLPANQFCKKISQNANRQFYMIDMRTFSSNIEQQHFHNLLFKDELLAVISTVNDEGLLVISFANNLKEKEAITHLYQKQVEAIETAKTLQGKSLDDVIKSYEKNQKN